MIPSRLLADADRLDARYFLSAGFAAARFVASAAARGVPTRRLGGAGGIARVWAPGRFRRVYAAPGERALPYLRPYDVFEYIPGAADYLSERGTPRRVDYEIRRGTILQTCSGRNLGPAVMVDAHLAGFLLSHDMVRIDCENIDDSYFVLAFLRSRIGQQLIRRDRTGSVIDHISPEHLASIDVPMLPDAWYWRIGELMRTAVVSREEARHKLTAASASLHAALPPVTEGPPKRAGWTVLSSSLGGRLDAEFHQSAVSALRHSLRANGGVLVGDLADVRKPPGRYRTWWVEEALGHPILSGAQLLQEEPINLRYKSPLAFKDISAYELRSGWIAYPMDGRAEESLGQPVMVTSDRDGWLASEHIGRVIPRDGVDGPSLYAALATVHAQRQIKSRAFGSVVDTTLPADMANVVVPDLDLVDGAAVLHAWERFAAAKRAEMEAIALVDEALLVLSGAPE